MLTTITAIVGLFTGLTGLILSLRNHLLDRERLAIKLEWDVSERYTGMHYGFITVTNIGRRPMFIVSVGLEINCEHSLLPFKSDLYDKKTIAHRLNEGDEPLIIKISQSEDFLIGHAEFWRDIRAFAVDSKEKVYLAKRVNYCPSWGIGNGRPARKYHLQGSVLRFSLPVSNKLAIEQ
jgi:hypothetical protein